MSFLSKNLDIPLTEATEAKDMPVFEYASSTSPFRRIVSVIRPANSPSIKIAKRCGARQENGVTDYWIVTDKGVVAESPSASVAVTLMMDDNVTFSKSAVDAEGSCVPSPL
jgi:1,2-phenylacetyl-CoA epoxidase PaaB subunit